MIANMSAPMCADQTLIRIWKRIYSAAQGGTAAHSRLA